MRIDKHVVNDGVIRLAVAGEIDLATCDDLYDAVVTAAGADRAAEVVVDLAEVSFCDSSGIGAIMRARNLAAAMGVGVLVINPYGGVRRVLDITGVLSTLNSPNT